MTLDTSREWANAMLHVDLDGPLPSSAQDVAAFIAGPLPKPLPVYATYLRHLQEVDHAGPEAAAHLADCGSAVMLACDIGHVSRAHVELGASIYFVYIIDAV